MSLAAAAAAPKVPQVPVGRKPDRVCQGCMAAAGRSALRVLLLPVAGGSDDAGDPDTWVTASHKVFKVNGDGHLLYPGARKEPVPPIRLEVIRDGIEDYEYLALLMARLGEAPVSQAAKNRYEALLQVGPKISPSLTSFATDARVIWEKREEIALAASQSRLNQSLGVLP